VLLQQLLNDGSSLEQLRQRLAKDFPRLRGLDGLTAEDDGPRVARAPVRDMGGECLPEQPEGPLQLVVTPARYGSDLLSRYSIRLASRKKVPAAIMNPGDAAQRGFEEGRAIVIDSDCGSFNLPLRCDPQVAVGCVVVENGAELAQPVPGLGLSYCQIHREVADE
jgi:NADH-quinone oxidoreductase subunit G